MAVPKKRYRQLRRDATESEELWSMLRNRQFGGFKFRRQVRKNYMNQKLSRLTIPHPNPLPEG